MAIRHAICGKHFVVFAMTLMVAFFSHVALAKADKVEMYQDIKGWKLKVNGNDFFVKGMVWGYSPRDENYTYNLWGQDEAFIEKVLDHDFGLMQKAGVNAIRSFSTIPPKWVTYIYKKYGIMTAINPLMGRYGANIDGEWIVNTDYSDSRTREVLKKQVLDDVRKFKDVPGVLMFALGNESNYGLSWKSFEIENLPVGEQNKKKATYLYSLFGEVIAESRKIDSNHPFTIVNGDIQYIDLIAKYGKDWDLLGVNAYRGISFTGLWKDTKAKYGKPVLFFEFGSDAFNAKEFREDQVAQAQYLKGQWQEMYQKSYGNGEEGNSIGGFVFEWRDEWWKYKQTENLDKHDRTASWGNGGYKFDFAEGQNNMNEEWWGIARLGKANKDGVFVAEPRVAYDVLTDVWKVDPYKTNKSTFNSVVSKISPAKYAENRPADLGNQSFRFAGGTIKADTTDIPDDEYTLMGFFDFEFQPTRDISGDFTVNVIADSSNSDFEFKYGDRIHDFEGKDARRFEIYDFQASYTGKHFDLKGFYHVPRYHWGDEGDFFGLLRETTDMEGQDIWNAKAPSGFEFEGKTGVLDGLKIVAGPEVYWGANPKAIVKYQFGKDKQYTIMHSEDLDRATSSDGSGGSIAQKSRQTSLHGKFQPRPGMDLEVGGLISGTHKIDDKFDRYENGNVIEDKIEDKDTLAAKAKLKFNVNPSTKAYVAGTYAGLVADSGEQFREMGTQLPYSSLGNKKELEAGLLVTKGDYTIAPRVLYRESLIDANPLINASISGTTVTPGIEPRNSESDPFAVLDNRSARAAELYLTYDPTPATYFYDWDNDRREDAKFAYNVGLTVVDYKEPTDSYLFTDPALGDGNFAFGEGLPAEQTWLLKSKMVFNPRPGLKAVVKAEAGKQQPTGAPREPNLPDGSTGAPVAAVNYHGLQGKLIVNNQHIFTAGFKKNAWGNYDFHRQFNIKYPEQLELGYTRLLDKGVSEKKSSKIGIKGLYRTLDKYSGEHYHGKDDDMYEVRTFLEYNF